MKITRPLSLITILLMGVFYSFGQPNNWKQYKDDSFLRFEVKTTLCEVNKREQFLVLLKLTNISNEKRTYTWKVNQWRNNECVNCSNNNEEQFVSITLNPGEKIEGSCDSKLNKATYIFDHYLKWVEGMTKQTLTNFEFVNISSKIVL